MTVAPDVPDWDRGRQLQGSGGFGETSESINAAAVLIEYAFHTNTEDVSWITNNYDRIADATVAGIVNYILK